MLGLAKRVKAKIFQASTSEVYGDPQVLHNWKNYWGHTNPIGIRSCYDEGNVARKHCSLIIIDSTNCVIKVARIFNTYGPRMHPNDGRLSLIS